MAVGRIAARSVKALGTTATVVVDPPHVIDRALDILGKELCAIDDACSRFRYDSEISALERRWGRRTQISPLLFEALSVALDVAVLTAGTVDPTVGGAVTSIGYDRDFDLIGPDAACGQQVLTEPVRHVPAPGWWTVDLDESSCTAKVAPGTSLDLGSTAKALASDRSADRIFGELGCATLVNLGGDISVRGPSPVDGWSVGIAHSSTIDTELSDEVIAVSVGGVASSGTAIRRWNGHGRTVHHIVDPATGDCAEEVFTLATVAAPTCVEANAFSTAAIVWGRDAPGNLDRRGVCARLVERNGCVHHTGNWPR